MYHTSSMDNNDDQDNSVQQRSEREIEVECVA